jgi:Transcriptional regulator
MNNKRKQNLVAFHQDTIIKEANELFKKKGIAKTTMDDIARASGYSKSTVYVYFKSKDDIFQHIIYNCVVMIRDQLRQLTAQHENGADFYNAVCTMLIEMHDQNPVFFEGISGKTILVANDNITPSIIEKTDAARAEIHALLLERLSKSNKSHLIRDDIDRLELVYILWSCIYGIIEMGNAKSDYIRNKFKKERNEFIRQGLGNLLRLVYKPGM